MDSSSISFTAHYTAQTWQEHGLSLPQLKTGAGEAMYRAMAPAERAGRVLLGTNLHAMLVERHTTMDRLLGEILDGAPATQVLEIACGLSARGYRFSQSHPGIRYVEADLPRMAATKSALLAKVEGLSPEHKVVPIDILAAEGQHSLEAVLAAAFDRGRPIAVITEGLMNYFQLPVADGFWRRLVAALKHFPAGTYLTETYPVPDRALMRLVARAGAAGLRVISRSGAAIHFATDADAVAHLRRAGFGDVQSHRPNGRSLVRIIVARTA
ncbi:class I SAM-dependent methyltransferase [Oleomonas cavernae]|uniref:Class I SAM-dependent methyltransferase n=1 Tax=Oleomonas cavernae TaxID=2320859 RepID=A0A418WBG7_9PROT|nr:class I SAM-dependent methyltransferase [Oleomonas cavernae]RJF87387.1 class I SAM-dependent methyltransferase [Oleomonas cavernae]